MSGASLRGMGGEEAHRIYMLAKGVGEARVKHADVVRQLVALADGRREAIDEALQLARAEVKARETTPDAATGDTGPPQAPALLATRLLEEALALVLER